MATAPTHQHQRPELHPRKEHYRMKSPFNGLPKGGSFLTTFGTWDDPPS